MKRTLIADGVVRVEDGKEWHIEGVLTPPNDAVTKLCSTIHDLLGPFDGRDPDTDGPIDLETNGARIRKAQKVLEEVE